MNHALITGGAGFIGLHLARRLIEEGWRVDLFDSFERAERDGDFVTVADSPALRLIEADLCDRTTVEALPDHYSHVFHFAALLGVQNVAARPHAVLETNLQLTASALALARKQRRLARFVYASTSEVYAGALEYCGVEIPTPETTPLTLSDLSRPRTSYMLSKIYGEALCHHAGVPFTIIRPHNIYGPRMGRAHVIPQLLERAHATASGGTLQVYSVEHTRTFCFVDDAVEMVLDLALSDTAAGKTVNVGTAAPEITMRRLAETVIAVIGKPLTIEPLPPTEGSPARRAPDMSLCAALTGHSSRIGVEDGVQRTWDWYAAHPPSG